MRKVEFLLAVGAILLVATSMTGAFATKFSVEPGVVYQLTQTVGHDLPHQLPVPGFGYITGSVTLTESENGSNAQTANTGGGCLIYLTPKFKDCTNDDWCPVGGNGSRSNSNLVQGYCTYISDDAERIMMGKVRKGCWYKPVPESCVRRPDDGHPSPLPLQRQLDFMPPTPIHPPGVNGRIYWRVLSCQNLVALGCKNRTPNGFVYKFGEIRKFD